MHPLLLTATALAQVAWLATRGLASAPPLAPLSWALAIVAVFAFFAFTRLRWGAHLDMYLIMCGPGGLAMLAPEMFFGVTCPLHSSGEHLAWMSIAMGSLSLPWTWRWARCVAQARAEGRAGYVLLADAVGMQLGMSAAHAALGFLPEGAKAKLMLEPALPWLNQGLMLLAMSLGMAAASGLATMARQRKLASK